MSEEKTEECRLQCESAWESASERPSRECGVQGGEVDKRAWTATGGEGGRVKNSVIEAWPGLGLAV